MNSRHLKQASIPILAILTIWWWSGSDEPVRDAPEHQSQAEQQTATAAPKRGRDPGYHADDRRRPQMDAGYPTDDHAYTQRPTQQYWAPEQTHFGPYRFRPLSEREKRRLYSAAPAYAEPARDQFRPRSYARTFPNPVSPIPGYDTPRWNDPDPGGYYSYRPTESIRAQSRRWRSGSDPETRRSSPYQQGPEPWLGRDDRWTAEYPSWQSPAERMLPAAEIGLDPTLSYLY